jgi:hypothetical protein
MYKYDIVLTVKRGFKMDDATWMQLITMEPDKNGHLNKHIISYQASKFGEGMRKFFSPI